MELSSLDFIGTASSVLKNGCSSAGRAVVSKTKGREFDSYLPCKVEEMESLKSYIVGAYQELLHKVTWPSWAELQSSGVIVFVASAIIGIIILLMDLASKNVTDVIYKFLMSL